MCVDSSSGMALDDRNIHSIASHSILASSTISISGSALTVVGTMARDMAQFLRDIGGDN